MPRRAWWFSPALLLVPLFAGSLGGWAIVTVEDLPEYAVAGQPLTLRFTVRQHGVSPLAGLIPRIEAKSDNGQPRVLATARQPAGRAAGQYAVTFTLPAPGEWTVTIHSGFGNSKLTLLPIPAIRHGTTAPVTLAAAERGRRLFVAKGCIGCHTRNEDGLGKGEEIAPELTGKRYQPEFLGRFLSDPAANPTRTGTFRMPNLGLGSEEIAALVTFLNGERTAAR
ncbi:MAG: c-type cytochrome [Gemmatimonadales bacterium]